ncbi:ABC transporter related protein [Ferroglobus placidus DSM 10642]|uniref:ABC transporter related protein n=1 Tax=Ferroglobus placidus (strain DSM 10642 / AEDII12DO) TaxID=589924 RepID=D3S104_FERPA|nr:ABC transporter related protein [Ferroglobus placidus DSM 10642]
MKAERISYYADGKRVLENCYIELRKGEIVLLLGPNGSGKTTFFKCIAGILKHGGSVIVDGVDASKMKAHERFRLGVVYSPERMRVAENLSVKENLKITGDINEALKLFPELKKLLKLKAGNLSGGERQLVVLARSLISKPKYLLLDEPFAGLSEKVFERVLKILVEKSKEMGIAIITHERVESILPYVARVYSILSGKIVSVIEENFEDELRKYLLID